MRIFESKTQRRTTSLNCSSHNKGLDNKHRKQQNHHNLTKVSKARYLTLKVKLICPSRKHSFLLRVSLPSNWDQFHEPRRRRSNQSLQIDYPKSQPLSRIKLDNLTWNQSICFTYIFSRSLISRKKASLIREEENNWSFGKPEDEINMMNYRHGS